MAKKEVLRDYNLTDGELAQVADQYHTLLTRDATQFAAYGIDGGALAEFTDMTANFKEMPTDAELDGERMVATENKTAAATSLKSAIRGVLIRAKDAYGLESGKYRRFGAETLERQTDAELSVTGRRVVRVATASLTELAPKGLTAAIIADVAAKSTAYDAALDAQDDAVRLRDIRTAERREAGNALYARISTYAAYGKEIWREKDEARYNDYIIYGSVAEEKDEEAKTEEPAAE